MAGQEIYLGKMIEALQADITTMASAMAAQTAELQNINLAVAQTTPALNVKPGTDFVQTYANAAMTIPSTAKMAIMNMVSTANGSVRFKFGHKSLSSPPKLQLFYSYDNVTWTKFYDSPGVASQTIQATAVLPVKAGALYISVASENSYNVYIEANSVSINYSLKNAVTEGAFAY